MAVAYLDEDERVSCLDAALKECIDQISSLQEERELELKEANKRLVRSLLCKKELVEELKRDNLHLEGRLDGLIDRVDYVEKENAFLKCECCALERELLLKHGQWPWNVVDMILEEHRVSKRSVNELLEEIKSQVDTTCNDSQNVMTKMIKIQCDLQEENKWLKAANQGFETLLEESEESIGRLQEEVRIAKDQFEDQKLINEDLDTQVCVTMAKQKEMARNLSCLEVELEDKNQSYQDLETTCLELQLQLQILSRKGTPDRAEFQKRVDEEKPKQHHSLLDILRLTDDDDTKTEASCPADTTAARVITVVSSQTPGGGFGFAKKLFMNLHRNASTLKRSKRSYSSSAVDEFHL